MFVITTLSKHHSLHSCIIALWVSCVFQSHDWIRVRIQQMEPDLMEVGTSLEEARALRREHDELLRKLDVSAW